MITDALIHVLFGVARLVLNLLPDWTPPSIFDSIGSRASALGAGASGFTTWIPLGTAVPVLSAVVALIVLTRAWHVIQFLRKHIPFIGGGG